MTCIIIEDQAPAQRILKRYIKDSGLLELKATFTDALSSIDFIQNNKIDIIFLDIHLPKLSGIDFLKSLNNPPSVIFTTAFPDFALEGYDLNIIDYLLKPFSFARFLQAINKIPKIKTSPSDTTTDNQKFIYIKSGFDYHRVAINDISHIHSDKDYTEIHITDNKLLSQETLKYWESQFDPEQFIRIHKSYIINCEYVAKVNSSEVELKNKINIPIGRAYKKWVLKMIS